MISCFLLSSFYLFLNYKTDRHLPSCLYGCMSIYMRVWEWVCVRESAFSWLRNKGSWPVLPRGHTTEMGRKRESRERHINVPRTFSGTYRNVHRWKMMSLNVVILCTWETWVQKSPPNLVFRVGRSDISGPERMSVQSTAEMKLYGVSIVCQILKFAYIFIHAVGCTAPPLPPSKRCDGVSQKQAQTAQYLGTPP